jgi:hypothetical protein
MQKHLQGFGPGLVDLFPANIFVAIAKVQAYEANELFRVAIFYSFAQIRH